MNPPLAASRTLNEVVSVGAIAGVFAGYLLLVPPTGEFPSADDFDLAASAWHLAGTGHLRLSDWPEMTLIGHVMWGGLFTAVGGRSFFVLRLSMFAMSAITAFALYAWSRKCGQPRRLSIWFAMTLAVNPLIVHLQYTFMTDLSGVAGAALLILLAPRLDASARLPLIGYSILAGAAYCTRETAAIPFLVYSGLACLHALSRLRFGTIFWLLAPFAMMAIGYELWLHLLHGVPSFRKLPNIRVGSVSHHVERLFVVSGMLALQLLPVSVLLLIHERLLRERKVWIVSSLVVAVAVGTFLIFVGELPAPYGGQLFDLGLRMPELPAGELPANLRGETFHWGPYSISMFRLVMTGLALASSIVFGTWLLSRRRKIRAAWDAFDLNVLVPGLTSIATLLLFLVTGSYFERYLPVLLLPVMMTAAALISTQESRRRSVPLMAWLASAGIGLCSLIGIQDGMQRSRAFWSAIDKVHELGIQPIHIDGGLAYAGFYRFNPFYRGEANLGPFLDKVAPDERANVLAAMSPESLTGNRFFRVSYLRKAGYDVVATTTYQSWFRSGEIFTELRNDTDRDQLAPRIQQWLAESERSLMVPRNRPPPTDLHESCHQLPEQCRLAPEARPAVP